jgi:mono/diheme cytochrome c family protein
MKHILLFLVIGTIIIACGNTNSNSDRSGSSTAEATEASKPDGEKIYKQYCIACHGLYGDMGASGAYNLQESKLKLEERIAVITNGRNAMTAFESLLDKKEIKEVAKYTMTIGRK